MKPRLDPPRQSLVFDPSAPASPARKTLDDMGFYSKERVKSASIILRLEASGELRKIR